MVTTSVSPAEGIYSNKSPQQTEGTKVVDREVPVNMQTQASRLLTDHFRCPDEFADLTVSENQSATPGYFRFGDDVICYGQCSIGTPAGTVTEPLHDALQDVRITGSSVQLPFDPSQIVNNL